MQDFQKGLEGDFVQKEIQQMMLNESGNTSLS
jgi:hypothetical protein